MNCFNHLEIRAVCSCSACDIKLCQDCMEAGTGKCINDQACAKRRKELSKITEEALEACRLRERTKKLEFYRRSKQLKEPTITVEFAIEALFKGHFLVFLGIVSCAIFWHMLGYIYKYFKKRS
jgi:hypothetical protein